MAGIVASRSREGRDGLKRKHDKGDGDTDDDDDDDDKKNKDFEVKEKKIPRSDVSVNCPAALILCERWGSSIHGGIAASLYQLIDQLKSCGLNIHCTILEEDANAVREAERLGVTLVSPARKPLFEKEKPSYIWLQAYDTFFPHLKKIKGLMFVFGFGITSSAVALDIKDNVVPDSEYIHVNVWNPEELCHEMFPYGKEVFEHKCKLLDEQSYRAFAVLSLGPKVFDHFDYRYDEDPPVKHLQLLPLPGECYFDIPLPRKLPDSSHFRIMTPFEHFAVSELNHSSVLPRAFNIMAESYDQFKKLGDPPKWEIICMNKHDDKEIGARLKPHSKLTVIPKGFQNDSFIKDVRHSHLVVVPPRSNDSLTFIVTMIAIGKPMLVPSASEGDIFISKYFVDYRPHVVVEMRGSPDALKDQMIRIVQDYPMYLNQASKMREMLKTTVIEQMKDVNSVFEKEIHEHLQRATSEWHIPNPLSTESNESEHGNSQPSTSAGSLSISQSAPSSDREICTIGVQVGTSQGHAVNGASMLNVENGFYQREGNRPTTEGTGRVLSDVHDDLEVTKVDKGSLRYVMKCGSLEALEALWSEYVSGRLDKTIHSTIITPTLLSKIQAHYLTLDIYIPVQEYLLCKREIPLLTGSVPTPSRRRSVAAITELRLHRVRILPGTIQWTV
ncbi:uncharacterized protein [Ptychodera flava]|uniref:uncharacterized protein n=1 Tax=Ptychodera flava TaxID=63121 RepID=UPI00396A2781